MSIYKKALEDFKERYVAFAALTILGQSCLGSIAAMFILKNGTDSIHFIQLAFAVLLTMAVNTAIISHQKPKTVFNILIWAVLVNTILIIVNTLFL